VLNVLLAFALFFGPTISAGAAVAGTDTKSAESTAASAKAGSRALPVTQEEREAAAERMKLKMKLAQKSSSGGVSAQALPAPGPGGTPDYFSLTPNWAYTPLLKKFVDDLPGVGPANASTTLDKYISVAHPDTITYPGSDYYEIELRDYSAKFHTDLPATPLRGYVQTNLGTDEDGNNTIAPDAISYLGPIINATKDRPVRVKFTNKLGLGADGDLFLPVDTTVMGAGMGPLGEAGGMYTQNRATLHLHGGKTVWISDGTPHQWITPAGEDTPYPEGVSVQNVPDMPDPGDGSQTFFYSNQQSARMLWYHDHSYGITRLNVYAGEAAGYFITDDVEKKLKADGIIPSDEIPLIIQDKTFVNESAITTTDPTWNWGSTPGTPRTGDLWFPHVYVPAQNPGDISGVNPTGRWHYGPWFWPPTKNITHPPVPNPYYDPINAPWEPKLAPGVPDNSMGMEAFHDTPIVNGVAYPTVNVDPKAYRLKILNAASDRFWNLQMYTADETTLSADGRGLTEVKMVDAAPNPAHPEGWPTDGRDGGVPDPATAGPDWIQIASEGGFLPKPAVIGQQPITWNMDPTTFNFGNVDLHSLLVAPAERADVVVDFSDFRGKTIILYNDAPAAFPARDPRLDYYTNNGDYTDTGGTVPTKVGFGPNTRTIMQIKVADVDPAATFDLAALEAAFASTDTTQGAFAQGQNEPIVPNDRYNSAYNADFPVDAYTRIYDNELTFKTMDGTTVTFPLEPKAIQDEMGEAFDTEYGRMSGKLGLEMPFTNAGNANFILYSFFDPVTENLKDAMEPLTPVLGDGTQIWKITHNGVDTHPIHFHLFDVQLINRVGWDGFIRLPDDNELGWKDTVRVSPLEDTIVALRPVAPKATFGVPDSVRPLDPTQAIGGTMGFSGLDPNTGQRFDVPVTNQMTDFGWEYVWHCHILSHEEMDMMRPMSLDVTTVKPSAPTASVARATVGADVTWVDPTPVAAPTTLGNPANEIGFRIERATYDPHGKLGAYSVVGSALANATTYNDATASSTGVYSYRVIAYNNSGETASAAKTLGTPGAPVVTTRITGVDRYQTAVNAAQKAFPAWTGVTDVVIASGESEVDALSAAGLAGAYNAPLLLVQRAALPTYTRSALVAMPDGLKVHIVGGTAAVNTSVATAIGSTPGVSSVERVPSGPDRYSTAANVAARMKTVLGGAFPSAAFIVNGAATTNFYDAMTAAPAANKAHLPILLVTGTTVPAATTSAISSLGITRPIIVGGTTAVSSGVASTLGVPAGDRISGANRYATAATFATRSKTEGWLTFTNVGVASATIDGLAGGAAIGKLGGPMLLTAPTTLPSETQSFLVANQPEIFFVYVFGGTAAVSNSVVVSIQNALQ